MIIYCLKIICLLSFICCFKVFLRISMVLILRCWRVFLIIYSGLVMLMCSGRYFICCWVNGLRIGIFECWVVVFKKFFLILLLLWWFVCWWRWDLIRLILRSLLLGLRMLWEIGEFMYMFLFILFGCRNY